MTNVLDMLSDVDWKLREVVELSLPPSSNLSVEEQLEEVLSKLETINDLVSND